MEKSKTFTARETKEKYWCIEKAGKIVVHIDPCVDNGQKVAEAITDFMNGGYTKNVEENS